MDGPITSPVCSHQALPSSTTTASSTSSSSARQSPSSSKAVQHPPLPPPPPVDHTSTDPFLKDFTLVAEAAKRAQMAVMMRDFESIGL